MTEFKAIDHKKIALEKRLKTTGYFGAAFALGAVLASLGPTLPYLADLVGASVGQIGFVFSTRSLGYLIGSFIGGRLYDRLSSHRVMAFMLLVMLIAMASIPRVPVMWLLGLAMLVVGFGLGAVDVGGNAMITWTHGARSGPYLNGLYFFAGLGGILAPIIAAQIFAWGGGITWAYWGVALLILPPLLWLPAIPSPSGALHAARQEVKPQVDYLLITLFGLLFFLYVGVEVSYGGWIFTYSLARHLGSERTASILTSAFWLAITLGRLIAIPLSARLKPLMIIATNLVGIIASLAVMLNWPQSSLAVWVGSLGVGLSLASLFPTTFSFAERNLTITGKLTGMLWAAGSAGGILIPWLVGQAMDNYGPLAMMQTLITSAILGGLVFGGLVWRVRASLQPAEREAGGLQRPS